MKFRIACSLVIGFWAVFFLTGCGDMIRSLRQESREIDEEVERDRENSEATVQNYRPRTLKGLSANNVPDYESPSNRAYKRKLADRLSQAAEEAGDTAAVGYHRVTKDDFVDRVPRENSLWDGQGQSNYLFANNRRREIGDALTADVEKELRREIQYQLWMLLPPEQRKVRRSPSGSASDTVANAASGSAKGAAASLAGKAAEKAGADKGAESKAKDAAEEAAKTNMASTGKDDDVIRMEVVESIGNGMMRLLGQKRVVYRGVSRIVEVAALVNNKDIDDNNHTKSSHFLDVKAQVIQ